MRFTCSNGTVEPRPRELPSCLLKETEYSEVSAFYAYFCCDVHVMQVRQIEPYYLVTSDASGNWGCGAYGEKAWFQFQWPPSMLRCHITIKELIPVVFAAGTLVGGEVSTFSL